MEILGKYSAAWTLVVLGFIALYYLIRAAIATLRVRRDAAAEFEYRKNEGSLELQAGREDYIRAYNRFHAPRRDWYLGLSGLIATLLTPPAIILFKVVSEQIWKMNGSPYEYGEGTLVWQFMLFFVLIAFWGAFFYLTAQIYHRRRPFSFKDELRKELES